VAAVAEGCWQIKASAVAILARAGRLRAPTQEKAHLHHPYKAGSSSQSRSGSQWPDLSRKKESLVIFPFLSSSSSSFSAYVMIGLFISLTLGDDGDDGLEGSCLVDVCVVVVVQWASVMQQLIMGQERDAAAADIHYRRKRTRI
jgi:hypothetical protein